MNLYKADKRNISVGVTLDLLGDLLSQVAVSTKVPSKYNALLQFTRKICQYGYYEYEFYTLAAVYLFLVADTAIRERFIAELPERCHLLRGRESQIIDRNYDTIMQRLWEGWVIVGYEEVNSSLWVIMKWLKKKNILPDRFGRREIELIRQLRNNTMHLPATDYYAPTFIIPAVWRVIDIVNCLFDPAVREKEPKVLKQQKESQRQISRWLEHVVKSRA